MLGTGSNSGPRDRASASALRAGQRRALRIVFLLFAALCVNAAYLATVTFLEWLTDRLHQDYGYQLMFLAHLVLGLLLIVPVIAFGVSHGLRMRVLPNRRAVRAGVALFATALVLLASGIVLMRFDFFQVNQPEIRRLAYWVHVLTPFLVATLFVGHRLAGPGVRWRVGAKWVGISACLAAMAVAVQLREGGRGPRAAADPEERLHPSLAATAGGEPIPARALMMDEYCRSCHADAHEGWRYSAHRFSSFNNAAYRFSVRETRRALLERDGDVQASRFCAGCHDPVPLFTGRFDDADFDEDGPIAHAGITCSVCHRITRIDSVRGNADYTIEEPIHYPFAYSENEFLVWVNHHLVKAKPAFHKRTFLKPLHGRSDFCGTCHKVHLPPELNGYKWLRGQNHYDSHLLSGVSGHGVASFYYPPEATADCSGCHMPLRPSDDFAARDRDDSGEPSIHDHLFAAANTAVPHLVGMPEWVHTAHREFLEGVVRVDIFGLRDAAAIDGELVAPIGPGVPALVPGRSYLVEVVLRTLRIGHQLTQGTADSNEVWLEVLASSPDGILGHSGARGVDGSVDPWAYFANAYVLDREGRRIDRRNVQDIFVALYDHQIPPGAADVVHYRLDVPPDQRQSITLEAALRYRKFDTTFLRHIEGEDFVRNDLPITTLGQARVTLPIAAGVGVQEPAPEVPEWERWNDYGIGLLRTAGRGSGRGELRQAEEAFAHVESLGRADGAVNLARVYLAEGRLEDAALALRRAARHDPPAEPWTVAWLSALVNGQNGYLDPAIEGFRALAETRFPEARRRGFDFGLDYRLLNELGKALFEAAKRERGGSRRDAREAGLIEAAAVFERTLEIDPENVSAHYNLALIRAQLGDAAGAARHRALHAKYKPDDNARDRAVAIHRRAHPAADRAAEAVAIYELRSPAEAAAVATHDAAPR